MSNVPGRITLAQWGPHYEELRAEGLREASYGGPLQRHIEAGDLRLLKLQYDNSAASLRLWNFLLTEEDRLHQARAEKKKLVGTIKDLGTVPVMAYCLDGVVAFCPDGAWWIPCILELGAGRGVLGIADSLGIDESFCPVRAMLGAFVSCGHFPLPDLITCSVGATCDDVSAIAQRLEGLGHSILWWEIPHRRRPEPGEPAVRLPGGFSAPAAQVSFVKSELHRVRGVLETLTNERLDDEKLRAGILKANEVRRELAELRELAFTAPICPIPALEMLIAEMLALHFCSDRGEALVVLKELVAEVKRRVEAGEGVLTADAARVFWVNPVADLQVMNLLEETGGRVCGTDYLFCHALDLIPEDLLPMEALARMALADPMVGSSADRAERICSDIRTYGAEAVLISRIPGASHCAMEGAVIANVVARRLGIPVVEMEVPPVTDAMRPTLRTRLEALVETVKGRRTR